jgi:hypothetical protein
VVEVVRETDSAGFVQVDVDDVLKGTAGATMTVRDPGGTCSPGFAKGTRGVIFADSAGDVIGLYDGFLRGGLAIWTDALRRYLDGATAAERAAPLVELAVSKDWTRSFEAAMALSDRVELIAALDQDARDRIVKRLRKVATDHPLIRLAARLQDPRVLKLAKKRGMDDGDDGRALRAILAGAFEAETDPGALADVMTARKSKRATRAAALERCERIHGITLARFSDYLWNDDHTVWVTLADACRSGTPAP